MTPPGSFDPGAETDYAERGPRSHELDPEVGAAEFDPGPDRYDGRRAQRRRRRERAERKRRKKAERKRTDQPGRAGRGAASAAPADRGRGPAAAPPEQGPSPRLQPTGAQRSPGRRPPGLRPTGGHAPRHAPPPQIRPLEAKPSLRRPTLKAGLALAAIAAMAVGAGALLGLPLPGLGDSDAEQPAAAAPVAMVDPGTPAGLTKGPYHPVVIENPDYGEGAAKFGADRGGRKHEGQDVFAPPGTPLVAVRDGVALDGGGGRSFYSYGGGNTFVMYSPLDDRSYVYLHMKKPALVRAGDSVRAGQLIGYVGCTGSCDGNHLHFEVRRGRAIFGPQRKALDPLPLLRRWPRRPTSQ